MNPSRHSPQTRSETAGAKFWRSKRTAAGALHFTMPGYDRPFEKSNQEKGILPLGQGR